MAILPASRPDVPSWRVTDKPDIRVSGEDYIGLLIGDVTGNWLPGAARAIDSRQLPEGSWPEQKVSVNLPNLLSSAGKEVIIPISVQGAADKEIISYEFDLRYY